MRSCFHPQFHGHKDEEYHELPATGQWECALCDYVHDHVCWEKGRVGWYWGCYIEGCEIKTKHDHPESDEEDYCEGEEVDYEDEDEDEDEDGEDEDEDDIGELGAIEQLAPMNTQTFLEEARQARGYWEDRKRRRNWRELCREDTMVIRLRELVLQNVSFFLLKKRTQQGPLGTSLGTAGRER